MASEITPGQKVLVGPFTITEVRESASGTMCAGHDSNGNGELIYVSSGLLSVADLREVLRLRAVRSLIRTSWPWDMMGEVNAAEHELACLDDLLALLGEAG